jgi:Ca2+-binding EF-hand superfamily protein
MLAVLWLGTVAALQARGAGSLWHRAGQVPDLTASVKPGDLFGVCTKIAATGLGAPGHAEDACKKQIKDGATCKFLAEQMALFAHEKGADAHPNEFCGIVVQLSSASAKRDTLEYVSPREKWDMCVNSILAALETGRGAENEELAIRENVESACKTTVETKFQTMRLPGTIASVACSAFTKEVDGALSSGKLDPGNGGQSFCECAEAPCRVEKPFLKSKQCDVPNGFPMAPKDLGELSKAKLLDLDTFVKMCREAYGTSHIAFVTADADEDKKVSEKEFGELSVSLGLEPGETMHLFKVFDANGDGFIDAGEWSKTFVVTLDGLRQRILEKYKNSDAGFKAADADGDGSLNPAEFLAHCKSVDVGPSDASRLLKEVDADGDGKISEEEYKNALGVTLDELKTRARDEFGPPEKSFPAFDSSGDGQIDAEEWKAACEKLGIPEGRAADLLKEVDQDGDGQVSEEEFRAAMGMGVEDLKRAVYDKLGSAEEAMKAMDKDGDGVITEEEFVEELKKQGFGEKEAKEMYKELDADGDGKVTAEDFADATGAKALEKMRSDAGVGDEELLTGADGEGVAMPPSAAQADADGDGKISEDEYMDACKAAGTAEAECEELWDAADADGDGVASPEDLDRVREEAKAAAEAFGDADADGDGKLSKEEFMKAAAEQGIPADEAEELFKELEKDGSVSAEDFVAGGGFAGGEGSATPPPVDVPDVSMEELAKRVHAAFGTTGEAWEDIAGAKEANHMTPEQFAKVADQLGLLPEQAEKLYAEMDTNGDGKVDFAEFQTAMGVDKEDLKRRMMDKFGSGAKAFEAMDKDGDGEVSEEEFLAAAEEMGVPPELAKEMFKDVSKDGKPLGKDEFLEDFGADAGDVKERLAEQFDSADNAFDKFDADGNGEVSEEEFIKAAVEDMGLSEEEAKKIFAKADADGSGGLSRDEFKNAFGAGPEELREACFKNMKDPKYAFHQMDKNGDGLLSKDEFAAGLKEMGFTEGQIERLFKLADTNDGENTEGSISRYEFWTFLAYRPHRPHFMGTWATYYGDLDRWGYAHQKHNKLEHPAAFLALRASR